MRDIHDYEIKYKEEPCETYQVKYRRKKVLELLKKNENKYILEIGCGLEPLFQFYHDFKKMVIVEPSQNFVDNAKREARTYDGKIVCIQGFFEESVEEIKELNIRFDYIVLSSLLHEVEKPKNLLKAIKQLCSENTILHVNVPNAYSIHRLLAKEMGIIQEVHEISELQQTMQRNSVFDINTLSQILEECGYIVLEKGSYFPKFLSAKQMELMLKQGIVQENIFDGLDQMIKYFPEYGSEIYIQAKRKIL